MVGRSEQLRPGLVDISASRRYTARVQGWQFGDTCHAQATGVTAQQNEIDLCGPIQKAVAIELLYTLRDCTDWTTTIGFIDSLPDDLKNSPLVKEQRALALSKSGDHDTAIGALQELIRTSDDTSERRGLLGGRYKKKWAMTKNPADLDRAIAEYERGMKLDLNDYYPSSNLARLYAPESERVMTTGRAFRPPSR